MPSQNECNLAMLSHLSTFAGYIVPFGNIIAPLIIWQVKKDESPYVAAHAREALNFQITFMVLMVILTVSAVVLMLFFIGILLIPVIAILAVVEVVLTVLATVAAGRGERYHYPLTVRIV